MPTVPVIQDSAQLQTDTGRQRVRADPDAFGAAQARGTAALAQSVGRVGEVIEERDTEFDRANALDLDNQLSARIRERLYNPEDGYLASARGRGANAEANRAAIEAEIDTIAVELSSQARSPRSARLYQGAARDRVASTLNNIAQHATTQNTAYQNEVDSTGLSEVLDNIIAGHADGEHVRTQLDRADVLIAQAARRNGLDPALESRARDEFRSDAYSRVIAQLAVTNPVAAQEMFLLRLPDMTAQDAAEIRTTMRVAQSAAVERVEGMAWQAFANGQPLSSMGPEAYQEFITNPLYGASHARITEAYRTRADSYASGGRVRNNSPAYIAAVRESQLNEDYFTEAGTLEDYIAAHADAISNADIVRLYERRERIRTSAEGGGDAGSQATTFRALRTVAASSLGVHGLNLSPGQARNQDAARERAAAFDAALMREVEAFTAAENRQPNADEGQILIGRAVVGMNDASLQDMPEFRVEGNRGRTRRSAVLDRDIRVRPTTDAVVPYAAINEADARSIGTALQLRLGTVPSKGEVENAYAALLTARPRNADGFNQVLDQIVVGGGQ